MENEKSFERSLYALQVLKRAFEEGKKNDGMTFSTDECYAIEGVLGDAVDALFSALSNVHIDGAGD